MRTSLEQRIRLRLLWKHAHEAAAVLETLSSRDVALCLAEVRADVIAPVLRHMMMPAAASAVARLPLDQAQAVLGELRADFGAMLLRRIPDERRVELLAALSAPRRLALNRLLAEEPNTAGALMDPEEAVLPEEISVGEAQARVTKSDAEVHYNVFVVNRHHELVGVLTLSELMSAPANRSLASVMRQASFRLRNNQDISALLDHPGWQRVSALPVVDADGRFLGAIRHRTLRRLETERAERRAETPRSTSKALGELYAAGLGAVFETFASTTRAGLATDTGRE